MPINTKEEVSSGTFCTAMENLSIASPLTGVPKGTVKSSLSR